jgi:hypothetical protein
MWIDIWQDAGLRRVTDADAVGKHAVQVLQSIFTQFSPTGDKEDSSRAVLRPVLSGPSTFKTSTSDDWHLACC